MNILHHLKQEKVLKNRNLGLIFYGTIVRTVYQPGITRYIFGCWQEDFMEDKVLW
jgi:hypothetical protein